MNQLTLRREIMETARQFSSAGLSVGTSGNLSARTRRGFLITPSGLAYEDLVPDDIVELDTEGNRLTGRLVPSSEWQIHKDIYRARPEINAAVHVHSVYATAISCTRQAIPALHYHIALTGAATIHCADYATFGTQQLSANALLALDNRLACLLANHGQVALGNSISAALKMAIEVEQLAKLYCIASQIGNPVLLDDKEVDINIEKFRHYGQQRE